MSGVDQTRRRLLAGIGALAALGAGAWISMIRSPSTGPGRTAATTSTTPTTTPPESTTITEAALVTTPETTATTVPPATVDVICRSAWGASEPGAGLIEHHIERLTLHHTAVELTDNRDAPERARSHQAFHMGEGFPDLAYHFLVDLHGNVLEGRSVAYAGDTFTEYDPVGHLLVCCEGNYDSQSPTDAQIGAVAALFAWGVETYDVDPSTLAGHRDHASTTCPGDHLQQTITDGSLRTAIEAAVADGVTLSRICGTEGAARVAAIESGNA